MIRVVLVDDQELVREGVRVLCEGDGDIEVVATAEDGLHAQQVVRATAPDVVLMDIRMPVMDGIEATRRIVAELPSVRIVILTTYELEQYLFLALEAGASGFLAKDVAPDLLRAGIRTIAEGQSLLSPRATRALVESHRERAFPQLDNRPLAVLTEREREMVAFAGLGLSNAEIGRRLHLSPATVKTHLNRSMVKLGVHDRAQLVVVAYQTGLVRPGDPVPDRPGPARRG